MNNLAQPPKLLESFMIQNNVNSMKPLLMAILTLCFAANLYAQGSAGIVLYFKDQGNTYLLLADDVRKAKGWSAFGGAADKGETFQQTAVREASEETRGYFKKEWLEQQIRKQKPFREHGFTMFFVEIPFVPAQRIQNHPIKNKFSISMRERVNYAWVPEIELRYALENGKNEVNKLYLPRPIRAKYYNQHWFSAMKAAYKQKACPWLKSR